MFHSLPCNMANNVGPYINIEPPPTKMEPRSTNIKSPSNKIEPLPTNIEPPPTKKQKIRAQQQDYDKNRRTRSFSSKWQENRSWLTYKKDDIICNTGNCLLSVFIYRPRNFSLRIHYSVHCILYLLKVMQL